MTEKWRYVCMSNSMYFSISAIFCLLVLFLYGCQTRNHEYSGRSGSVSIQENKIEDFVRRTEANAITEIVVESLETGARTHGLTPVTFGFVFAKGDLPEGTYLEIIDDMGRLYPVQMDIKTRYGDGSICHAIISIMVDMGGKQEKRLVMIRTVDKFMMDSGLIRDEPKLYPIIQITQRNTVYRASLGTSIKGWGRIWLDGPIVREQIIPAEFLDINGNKHPRLHAEFHIRSYPDTGTARIDYVVENDWAYVDDPRNEKYSVQLFLNDKKIKSIENLNHHHHARWHYQYHVGGHDRIHVKMDVDYILSTGAVPSYDPDIRPTKRLIGKILDKVQKSDTGPMGYSIVTKYMGTAGGRPDIGPLPRWCAVYLLSQDSRMLQAILKIADTAGSWDIHYRDRNTGLPLSIDRHPKASWFASSTGADTDTPSCKTDCETGAEADVAHLPDLAYLPYLVTGDFFYLVELQFWANHAMLQRNPEYRDYERGLLKSHATRGQAWGLRTMAYAAYITPDSDPMKHYFLDKVNNNLKWYEETYTIPGKSPKYNPTGRLVYQWQKDSLEHKLWMDDFFTWTVGQVVDMGFDAGIPIRDFKARSPIGRMGSMPGDEGWCWAWAAPYRTIAGNSYQDTFTSAYAANKGAEKWIPLEECPGPGADMFKYPQNPQGYVSIFGAALAIAVDAGLPGAEKAWKLYESRARKPDWNNAGPDFAIVPRHIKH